MIRDYRAEDREACLALFDGNSAPYFAPSERADFAHFLDHEAEKWMFQVAERNARIIGCGGMAIGADGQTAHFCWGMVDRTLHRQGIGTALVRARLDRAAQAGVREVRLDTSQHSRAFYERLGFRIEIVTADGYGPGLDRCDMALTL
ncbi:GNAT family N-acetyltransferase [Sphingomonas fuzhouensis]|uniref:GNAT family N-acetyltransferase n=1 Tax=Sphingomonas fuzhouensis TaxID=3106033 RepID=UPI002B0009BF|nr:GNAT family N-acetyltransferase [Sphingomonas sp. SGZ-02]